MMNIDEKRIKSEISITKEWTLAFLGIISLQVFIYVVLIGFRETFRIQNLLNLSSLIPLFTFTSSVITEIGEVIIVIGMAFYQKWQENRQQKLRNQILQEVMQIANDKHDEWVKWAESVTESVTDQPSPPEKPIQPGNDENK